MSAATPAGAIRIGLGHGAITDFSGEEGGAGIIPPDRARLSGLTYLGLGDWHGRMQVGPATWYAGTPESDGFKHETMPGAMVVHIDGPESAPEAQMVPTGQFQWLRPTLDLLPGDDAPARLAERLPPEPSRRDVLMRVEVTGRLALAERAVLETRLAALAPDFGWFEGDLSRLAAEVGG